MIDSFSGQHAFLSNSYASEVRFADVPYPSVQEAYDALYRKYEEHDDWPAWKLSIMQRLVDDKFIVHQSLAICLIRTYPKILVFGNNLGNSFWGVTKSGGENHLGRSLMRIREKLRHDRYLLGRAFPNESSTRR